MPLTSRRETQPALSLSGLHVAPTGMIREAGIEARRIVAALTRQLQAAVQRGASGEERHSPGNVVFLPRPDKQPLGIQN